MSDNTYTTLVHLSGDLSQRTNLERVIGKDFVDTTPPCSGDDRIASILTTEENAAKLAARGCKTEEAPRIA